MQCVRAFQLHRNVLETKKMMTKSNFNFKNLVFIPSFSSRDLDKPSRPTSLVGSKSSKSDLEENLQFEIHSSILSIPSNSWNSFLDLDQSSSPFLQVSTSIIELRCINAIKIEADIETQ